MVIGMVTIRIYLQYLFHIFFSHQIRMTWIYCIEKGVIMKKVFALFLSLSLLLTGCSTGTESSEKKDESDQDKLSIYTTVYPLQYFTERIGGNFVQVNTIYPPGSDEHSFEPTQKDMMNLADADIFVYIGLGLEGFVEKAKNALKNENVTMLGAAEHIQLEETEHKENDEHDEDGHHHGDIDPHVWTDPVYAKDLALTIKDALIEKMPEQKEQFETNYSLLAKELDQLNQDFEKMVSESKHKEIIVSHSAFGYWEKRYGIKQISVAGLNTSNEPSQKQLQKIIEVAKKHNLKYVFFEQNVNSKLTEIIQKEIGAEPLVLHNLSVLTDDNIKNKATYFSLMEDNLEAIKKGLNE